jgi:hypothetical protein
VPIHGGGNAGGGGNRTEPRSQPQLEGVFYLHGGQRKCILVQNCIRKKRGPKELPGERHLFKKSLLSLGF